MIKSVMKLTVLASALTSVLAASTLTYAAQATQMKFCVVNMENVFKAVPQGLTAVNGLKEKLQTEAKKIQTSSAQLQKDVSDLEKNKPTMSKSDYKTKHAALEKKAQALQTKYMGLQQGAQQQEQTFMTAYQKQFVQVVQTVGKKEACDMVFASTAVPYYNPKLDVTDAVIAAYPKTTAKAAN